MKHIKSIMPKIERINNVKCAIWKYNNLIEITAQTGNIDKAIDISNYYENKFKYVLKQIIIHQKHITHAHIVLIKE